MNLPRQFEDRMKHLLQEEFNDYIESFNGERLYGLRINNLKINSEEFEKLYPLEIKRIPWINNGYYYNGKDQPAKHPYYYAGLYYIQEPSAMTPANLLHIEDGDKVLDLCAAPGGKSTELAAKLNGTGLLVSNDISASRAKALLKNIEINGITNAIVTCEDPSKLSNYFEGYFDKILVDAPCSGEGMFRKDTSMIKEWSESKVEYFSDIQKSIILQAAKMLKPGGYMLYSTCTFAPEENESTIEYLLDNCPDFSIESLPFLDGFDRGRPEWVNGREELSKCIRLWPHKINGEGHFIALLRKNGESVEVQESAYNYSKKKGLDDFYEFIENNTNLDLDNNRIEVVQDSVYYIPNGLVSLKGVRILRKGWYLGEIKKNRFEPSQSFAMGLTPEEYKSVINLSLEDPLTIKYLKGETIEVDGDNGWNLICVDGYPLGWGKLTDSTLKNKYYQGWRWL